MLKTILLASAAVALLAAPSFAVNSANIAITGSVAGVCSITNATTSIDLGNLPVDATTGLYTGSQFSEPMTGTVWCNGTSNTVTAVANPLITTAVTPLIGTFTNRIDYQLKINLVDWVTLDTASSPSVTINSLAPFSYTSNQNSTITTENTTLPPIAGNYAGSVVITVTPGP